MPEACVNGGVPRLGVEGQAILTSSLTALTAAPGRMTIDLYMTITELRDYCTSKPGVSYDFPFDEETCVFRIGGKMFALSGINTNPVRISLKCDPALSRDLRSAFRDVEPGYHLNKEHWNTVACGGDVPEEKVRWLIDHSYELVVEGLPKSRRPAP